MLYRNTHRSTWILALSLVVGLVLTLGIGLGCKKQTTTINAKRSGPAYVSVKTSPWSDVYLDDKLVGRSPVRRYQIASGEHTITVRCGPCKVKQEETVDFSVESGQTFTSTDIRFDVDKTSIK